MSHPMLFPGRAEGMDIEADVFTVSSIAIALQCPDLIESTAEIRATKRPVLVVLESVLVIKMKRPKFSEAHGKVDFVRRIEPREDSVRALDQATNSFGITREVCDSE